MAASWKRSWLAMMSCGSRSISHARSSKNCPVSGKSVSTSWCEALTYVIVGGLPAWMSGWTLIVLIAAAAWSVLPSTWKPRTPMLVV